MAGDLIRSLGHNSVARAGADLTMPPVGTAATPFHRRLNAQGRSDRQPPMLPEMIGMIVVLCQSRLKSPATGNQFVPAPGQMNWESALPWVNVWRK